MLQTIAALLVLVITTVLILRGSEVRLSLLLSGLLLASLAGQPLAIVRTFFDLFTREQFVIPLCFAMGFAYALKHTGCDQHLIHLLLRPLKWFRPLLVPGLVLVAFFVNIPLISQSGTAVAVGTVLIPVLQAARVSAPTTGAALALGASMGGELLNPGAPEWQTVANTLHIETFECVRAVWPLLLVHVLVTVPLFCLLCAWLDGPLEREPIQPVKDPLPVNYFKALVPIFPLALLFLTTLLPAETRSLLRQVLVGEGTGNFDSRLIGVAMLLGVVVAALAAPGKAGGVGRAFFDGAGYALANVTALIVVAGCFARGVELVGLVEPIQKAVTLAPGLLLPVAAVGPLVLAWISGSGMAAAQSLFGFYVEPSEATGVDPLRVGTLVSISAAAGRTLSPFSAVVQVSANQAGTAPAGLVVRMLPLLVGIAALIVTAAVLW